MSSRSTPILTLREHDIGYLPIDLPKEKDVGRTVRLDFKNFKLKDKGNIRSYIMLRDTAELLLDSSCVRFAEKRKIYVDEGNY